ncbi:MAG: hypothetical protein J6A89_06840 [Clostridia bacterium]|nr:hypothetical protein [Clostridia bacterium]
MKNAIKWIFIAICVVILAIDFIGFWKYKLKGSTNETPTSTQPVQDAAPEISYEELTSENFENGEKIFITNIKLNENEENKYIVKGRIYEEYEITKEEYNNIKSGESTIEIFGTEYSKDKIQSNNLKLKTSNEEAENFYIKYDSKTKKYLLKQSSTNYTVYKETEKYVQTTVDGDLDFIIQKNGKKNQSTIEEQAESYENIEIPTGVITTNLSELTFNKKGICTKITKEE